MTRNSELGVSTAVRVARAGREHAADLALIHGHCFTEAWDETTIAGLVADGGARVLLAEIDGNREGSERHGGSRPAGFIIGRVAADEAEILTLAVSHAHRRRGVGGALVQALIDALRDNGVDRLYLEVAASNTAARALYSRLNFVEVGRRADYYWRRAMPPDDAIVMEMTLPPRSREARSS